MKVFDPGCGASERGDGCCEYRPRIVSVAALALDIDGSARGQKTTRRRARRVTGRMYQVRLCLHLCCRAASGLSVGLSSFHCKSMIHRGGNKHVETYCDSVRSRGRFERWR